MSCVEYTGDSFKARWRPVEGATSYLVSVYNLVVDNYTMEPNYLLRQEETTDTCMTVTGCDPSLTYYYIVQSKGAGVSAESGYAMPAVPQLTAPLPLEPTNITSNSFTATGKRFPIRKATPPSCIRSIRLWPTKSCRLSTPTLPMPFARPAINLGAT